MPALQRLPQLTAMALEEAESLCHMAALTRCRRPAQIAAASTLRRCALRPRHQHCVSPALRLSLHAEGATNLAAALRQHSGLQARCPAGVHIQHQDKQVRRAASSAVMSAVGTAMELTSLSIEQVRRTLTSFVVMLQQLLQLKQLLHVPQPYSGIPHCSLFAAPQLQSLTTLRLVTHGVGIERHDIDAARRTARRLATLTALKRLEIDEAHSCDSTMHEVRGAPYVLTFMLAHASGGLRRLRELSAEPVVLMDGCVETLAAGPAQLTSLEKLMLSEHVLTATGTEVLAWALRHLPRLRALAVHTSYTKDSGAAGLCALQPALVGLTGLCALYLRRHVQGRSWGPAARLHVPHRPAPAVFDRQGGLQF